MKIIEFLRSTRASAMGTISAGVIIRGKNNRLEMERKTVYT